MMMMIMMMIMMMMMMMMIYRLTPCHLCRCKYDGSTTLFVRFEVFTAVTMKNGRLLGCYAVWHL
jgi:hypothetical protein